MMSVRLSDGSTGDVDYGKIGWSYSEYRRPDRRIAELILRSLGPAPTVLNVGAGAGSYEPTDRTVVAIEPSASMRAQRPSHLSPAIDGTAETLPMPDGSVDASMATFTVHQWRNLNAGLAEMRRVTRGPVVILSCDPTKLERFWLNSYAPEIIMVEARRYPPVEIIAAALGANTRVLPVAIPLDCTDGFGEAYYNRPECLLDPGARLACSAWSFVDAAVVRRFVAGLSRDLQSGDWDRQYGHLRKQPYFEGSLKLIVADP